MHNSQYRHLWTNAPKENLEFSDYSFYEHFGKAIPSFPPREVLRHYIMGRLHKNGVLDNSSKKMSIHLNTVTNHDYETPLFSRYVDSVFFMHLLFFIKIYNLDYQQSSFLDF